MDTPPPELDALRDTLRTGVARVVARLLRMGRKLVFGEVHISDARGALAHATTTYALV